MNVFEPCPFSKFAEGNERGVHGGVTVLLDVDGHMMGVRNYYETMER